MCHFAQERWWTDDPEMSFNSFSPSFLLLLLNQTCFYFYCRDKFTISTHLSHFSSVDQLTAGWIVNYLVI